MSDRSLRWLRILLASEWVLIAFGVSLAFLLEARLPSELQAFLRAEEEAEFSLGQVLAFIAMAFSLVLWVIGNIGCLLLWPPARWVYLASIVTGVLFMPFLGPTVLHPAADAVEEVSVLVAGAALGLLFFSPVSERFRRPRPDAALTAGTLNARVET